VVFGGEPHIRVLTPVCLPSKLAFDSLGLRKKKSSGGLLAKISEDSSPTGLTLSGRSGCLGNSLSALICGAEMCFGAQGSLPMGVWGHPRYFA
jgi:hypothetical protein